MSYAVAYAVAVAGLVIGLAATAAAIFTLREALIDRATLEAKGIGNGRRLIVDDAVRGEWSRLAAIVLLAGGLAALLFGQGAPDTADRAPVSVATVVTLAAYATGLAVMAFDGIRALRFRRHLDAELASHHDRLSAAEAVDPRGA